MFVGLYKKTNSMDAPGFASPIRTYRQNLSKMREFNDSNGTETTTLCSLGVVDLDLTVLVRVPMSSREISLPKAIFLFQCYL